MMNHATEKRLQMEIIRRRLEQAYDRRDWQETKALSSMIDRITVEQLKQSVRL